MKPIILPANQPRERFYAGGTAISAFRGDPPSPPNTPEDWIASVTKVRGESEAGLTRLADGSLLRDKVQQDPAGWLGADHIATFGPDPNLLVKLLDAGQRLPIHAHPDDDFAGEHLGTAHGKAEAWYIITPGVVHLGLAESVDADELDRLVLHQEASVLLSKMHSIDVASGDTVFVPPGMLHAVGSGIFLVEVQQPEDLSILVEWSGFDIDGASDGHLGLGFPTALMAIERTSRTRSSIKGLIRRAPKAGPVLARAARPFFRMDLVDVDGFADVGSGYGVAVLLEGQVTFRTEHGDVHADAGATILLPASSGPVAATGFGRALICRPPAPETGP